MDEKAGLALEINKNVFIHSKVMSVFTFFWKEFNYCNLCKAHRGETAIIAVSFGLYANI